MLPSEVLTKLEDMLALYEHELLIVEQELQERQRDYNRAKLLGEKKVITNVIDEITKIIKEMKGE